MSGEAQAIMEREERKENSVVGPRTWSCLCIRKLAEICLLLAL
jgi:hypothetical protein